MGICRPVIKYLDNMEIQLGISVSDNSVSTEKSTIVYDLSRSLNEYFIQKDFGNDVKKISIGFLMVFARQGYESWYKEKKPKYIEYKVSKSPLTGEAIEIFKTFFCEIRFPDELILRYIESDDNESKKLLCRSILNTFMVLRDLVWKYI
jgi:hypothetical protein